MTDCEPLAVIIERLRVATRPRAQEPVTLARKASDTGPPPGASERMPSRVNTNANRRNGGGGMYYRPRAAHYAGNPVQVTARPTAPSVKRSAGIKVTRTVTREAARAMAEDNGLRQRARAQANLARDAGELLPGESERITRVMNDIHQATRAAIKNGDTR